VVAAVVACLSRPELLPSVHDDHLVVVASAPVATPPDAVRDLGARISQDLASVHGVRSVAERIGRDETGDDATAVEHGAFDVALTPGLTAAAQRAVAADIARRLAQYPGLRPRIRSRFDAEQAGPDDAAPFRVAVFGPDLDQVDAAASRIGQVLGAIPGAGEIDLPDSARGPVVRADLNFQRLALFGLSAADVLDTVQAAFAGETVAQIYDGPRVVDLAIVAQDQVRRDPEAVGDLLLRSTSGISVPLKSVANVYLTDGPAVIAHENGVRAQVVEANPKPVDVARVAAAARAAIAAKVVLPPGVFLEYAQADDASRLQHGLAIDYALAIFAIFALLAVAFDGRAAGVILLAPLFAFAGGVAAVAMMGGVMSIGAIAGFIALLGLSIRGAILLISQVEDQVLGHHAPWSMQTVIAAARERAGPVILTALIVAVAVAPLAIHGGEAGREILGPMAAVILGGLLSGTLANLLILPSLLFAFWRPGYARWARRGQHAPIGPA
jgi:Cu/Ag efflux pump CusA